jgi:hypothetical protein
MQPSEQIGFIGCLLPRLTKLMQRNVYQEFDKDQKILKSSNDVTLLSTSTESSSIFNPKADSVTNFLDYTILYLCIKKLIFFRIK